MTVITVTDRNGKWIDSAAMKAEAGTAAHEAEITAFKARMRDKYGTGCYVFAAIPSNNEAGPLRRPVSPRKFALHG